MVKTNETFFQVVPPAQPGATAPERRRSVRTEDGPGRPAVTSGPALGDRARAGQGSRFGAARPKQYRRCSNARCCPGHWPRCWLSPHRGYRRRAGATRHALATPCPSSKSTRPASCTAALVASILRVGPRGAGGHIRRTRTGRWSHDAARPCLRRSTSDVVRHARSRTRSVACSAVPVSDTLKRDDGEQAWARRSHVTVCGAR